MARRSRAHDRTPLIAGAALAAAGLAGAGWALARRAREQQAPRREESWQCACGQRFRVSGLGRHRVYWLEGAREADPVLSERCPSCERLLPAERETAGAVA